MTKIKTFSLYLTVFITGAIVLVIEIAGTRLLAPLYGTTLFVWGSLITVTMACLSLGYYFGGLWVDNRPKLHLLALTSLIAGVWLLVLPHIKASILIFSMVFGLRWGPMVATVLLLAVPLYVLAMNSSIAVRLRQKTVDQAGGVAGYVFAVSTVGSLLGAVATAFYFLPTFPLSNIIRVSAVILLIMAVLWYLLLRSARGLIISLVALIVALIFFVLPAKTNAAIVYQTSSGYGQLQVIEIEGIRYVMLDGIPQNSGYNIGTKTFFPYIDALSFAPQLVDEPEKALLIGLGAGIVPGSWQGYDMDIDIVEIDNKIVDVAEDYFNLDVDSYSIIESDGRAYLELTDENYDVIVLDAFGGEQVASHLLTLEAVKSIRNHLTAEGVYVINTVGQLDAPMTAAMLNTLESEFNEVVMMATGNTATTIIYLAANDLPDDLDSLMDAYCLTVTCRDKLKRVMTVTENYHQGEFIITDDHNPIPLWQLDVTERYREATWNYYGFGLFVV